MLTSVLIAVLSIIPAAIDLGSTGADASKRQVPIVLYVSRSDCTFCRAFETEVLGPLVKSEVYEQAIFLELEMDSSATVTDFAHEPQQAAEIAAAFSVSVTPTILFLAPDGTELARRIVGYNRNEFFSFYIEKAINKARLALRLSTG